MKPLSRIKTAVALSVAVMSLMTAPAATAAVVAQPHAEGPQTLGVAVPSTAQSEAQLVRDYVRISAALLKSDAPRTVEQESGDFRLIAFHLDSLDFVALFYKNRPVLDTSGTGSGEVIDPHLSVGFDTGGPYIRLNSSEQAAAASGGAWVIATAICTVSGGSLCPLAGAIMALIVQVVTANGVCSNGHAMHVYWWAYRFSCE